jgi:hypothetical protein
VSLSNDIRRSAVGAHADVGDVQSSALLASGMDALHARTR